MGWLDVLHVGLGFTSEWCGWCYRSFLWFTSVERTPDIWRSLILILVSQKLCVKSGKGRQEALGVLGMGWKSSIDRMASKQPFVDLSYTSWRFAVLVGLQYWSAAQGWTAQDVTWDLEASVLPWAEVGKESMKGAGGRLWKWHGRNRALALNGCLELTVRAHNWALVTHRLVQNCLFRGWPVVETLTPSLAVSVTCPHLLLLGQQHSAESCDIFEWLWVSLEKANNT